MTGGTRWQRWQGYVALSLACLGVLGGAVWIARRPPGLPIEILQPTSTPPVTPAPIHVDVAGAVVSPGVYALPAGSLVYDAVSAAGGPAPEADLARVNRALHAEDGMQVYVPRQGEDVTANPVSPAVRGNTIVDLDAGNMVNINQATSAELEQLPGIGPVLAQRIIAGRPYRDIAELDGVEGIGPATMARLRDRITVD